MLYCIIASAEAEYSASSPLSNGPSVLSSVYDTLDHSAKPLFNCISHALFHTKEALTLHQQHAFIIQLVGYKNTGKTTSVCRLTERYKGLGLRVGTIKHDAHDFQIDTPGTDTWKHQAAGADITAITSASRTAILKQSKSELDALIAAIAQDVDIILIEGFKTAPYPKLVFAREADQLRLLESVSQPIALVGWPEALAAFSAEEYRLEPTLPVIPIDDEEALFALLESIRPHA
ncbi:molybdopterin-guanine dinucleotide biosynthesis protein B [Paenibacillus pinisoli]|uniref:Molybdopterin-guanine dinucleotide biosynthesis protein B n=1 Tax=Paenibacillus pinisoli TaxID=1276110 RepID=A0A3A6PMV5_9BACL|nr:molybdopterin-guanine dinucleotide biosynthesis protein B [Paenibacillus pinisoli]